MTSSTVNKCSGALVLAFAATLVGGRNTQWPAGISFPKRQVIGSTAAAASPSTRKSQAEPTKASVELSEAYGKLPVSFEANLGQSPSQVKFLARAKGYNLFLTSADAVLRVGNRNSELQTKRGLVRNWPAIRRLPVKGADRTAFELPILDFALRNARGTLGQSVTATEASSYQQQNLIEGKEAQSMVLRLRLIGTNPNPRVQGLDELPGKSNYFLGKDPRKWRTNISTYARVEYQDVYPGIDLVYHSHQGRLEYDFRVAPGADFQAIRLAIEGAGKPQFDAKGNLVLSTVDGTVVQHAPMIYQLADGVRKEISGGYLVKGEEVGFEVAAYNSHRPLIIDPVLSYSTYLGGSSSDGGVQIAADLSGNAYVTGFVDSTDFPTSNSLQSELSGGTGRDAFVLKLSPDGSQLIYSTYLGGSGFEVGYDIAVDAFGNAYVSGLTTSSDFPTVNPMQQGFGGSSDAFVAKLNPTGSALVYSTYLGGSGEEGGFSGPAISLDSSGHAYVTGTTASFDFPTTDPIQPTFGGGLFDIFVTKLNSAGSTRLYSTYLGGNGFDAESHIAVDSANNACVLIGFTDSTDLLTTPSAAQRSFGGGGSDSFVAKLNSSGSALVYATYLGGTGDETGFDVAIDALGNGYVTGETASLDFPTVNAFQSQLGGGDCIAQVPGGPSFPVPCPDAFVTKINRSGSAFLYSTYLGGRGTEFGRSIAVDLFNNACVTGFTGSLNFPTANPSQPRSGGDADAFVTKFNRSGSALRFSTYLGGSGVDDGSGMATDAIGSIYITGATFSANFPTLNAIQSSGSRFDAFVAKFREIVTFDSIAQAIQQFTADGLIDNQGVSRSLLEQLTNAAEAMKRGNPEAARNTLRAMANHIKAQTGKHIDPVAAQALQLIADLLP